LLVGETGVGKEVLARHIHALSARREGPFIAINCAAIGESLAESTLFGHERGSFTGAHARHSGVFEAASGGTLLLDEVGELSPAMQARLLRVLEERKVQRVGGTTALDVDVRILAATHRDLDEDVKQGRFRKDLLYRLAVLRVTIPPLRDRPDDIVFLAKRFLKSSADGEVSIAEPALKALRAHRFEGNIRELKNLMEGALALGDGRVVTLADLPGLKHQTRGHGASRGRLDAHLEEVEKSDITSALEACGGNQSAAARRLGISRRALIYRMEKHGLKPKPASA
jgi:transcriptional regulator with PAS, ATPase and Fis domain